jgi:hypothetical protein
MRQKRSVKYKTPFTIKFDFENRVRIENSFLNLHNTNFFYIIIISGASNITIEGSAGHIFGGDGSGFLLFYFLWGCCSRGRGCSRRLFFYNFPYNFQLWCGFFGLCLSQRDGLTTETLLALSIKYLQKKQKPS